MYFVCILMYCRLDVKYIQIHVEYTAHLVFRSKYMYCDGIHSNTSEYTEIHVVIHVFLSARTIHAIRAEIHYDTPEYTCRNQYNLNSLQYTQIQNRIHVFHSRMAIRCNTPSIQSEYIGIRVSSVDVSNTRQMHVQYMRNTQYCAYSASCSASVLVKGQETLLLLVTRVYRFTPRSGSRLRAFGTLL